MKEIEKEEKKEEFKSFRKEDKPFQDIQFKALEKEVEKAKEPLKKIQKAQYAIKIAMIVVESAKPKVPKKVREIADAIRRDNPKLDDEAAYRMSWESYCSYINPKHKGCTPKGKSKRKSPKPY